MFESYRDIDDLDMREALIRVDTLEKIFADLSKESSIPLKKLKLSMYKSLNKISELKENKV